jgi:hypothetical protein
VAAGAATYAGAAAGIYAGVTSIGDSLVAAASGAERDGGLATGGKIIFMRPCIIQIHS